MNRRLSAVVALAGVVLFAQVAAAQGKQQKPLSSYNWQHGPSKIAVGNAITLDLPSEYVYLAGQGAKDLMESFGNFHNERVLGVVTDPADPQWWALYEYTPDGYVADDEKIDADDLLKAFTEGTEEGNKEREEKGFRPFHVDGWDQKPTYDKVAHRLIWSLRLRSEGGSSINYETRILGRKGFLSIVLITSEARYAQDKPHVQKLLELTKFDAGSRYEDFDKKTDKVAEYGLTGLILGGAGLGAAKLVKLGFFAKFGKFFLLLFAKLGKGIVALFAGLVAAVGRLFGRKGNDDDGAPPAGDPPVAGGSPPPDEPPPSPPV